MTALDAFLAPIGSESPSGAELRHDPRFHALERLLDPASRRVRALTPDSDPPVDWDEVLRQAEALAGEGRDLRLLAIVARALANLRGLDGAAEGLGLLARTLDDYWDSVHPALRDRPSPRESAVRRLSALAQIENDEDGLLCDLAHMIVVEKRGLGRHSGADLAAAALTRTALLAEMGVPLGEADKARIAAEHDQRVARVRTTLRALLVEEPERLAALAAAVEGARTALSRLEASLAARLDENGGGVGYDALQRLLARMSATLAAAGSEAGAVEAAAPAGRGANGTDAAPIVLAPRGAAPPGAIASRGDVERALDQIVAFYDATEPASPIPLLLRRARRMVPMTFLQLMEEMAPSGLKEVRTLTGTGDEKKS